MSVHFTEAEAVALVGGYIIDRLANPLTVDPDAIGEIVDTRTDDNRAWKLVVKFPHQEEEYVIIKAVFEQAYELVDLDRYTNW
jgi:hypothetical protein